MAASREDVDERIATLRSFGALRRALRTAETVEDVAAETVRFATRELGYAHASLFCAFGAEEDYRLIRASDEGTALPEAIARDSALVEQLAAAPSVNDAEPIAGSTALALRGGPDKLAGILLVAGRTLPPEIHEELAFDVESALSTRLVAHLRAEELAMLEIQERELVGMLREVQERDAIIQRDLEEARHFQRRMLGAPPRVDRASVEVVYLPLGLVGGDLYAVSSDGNRLRLFIADATGHGVRASLTTMFIKSGYDAVRGSASGPAALLEALNDNISRAYGSAEMLFSAGCVDIDLATGELAFASAAHPPVCIVQDGRATLLEGGGAFLGLRARMRFEEHTMKLSDGDGVYLFTDGFSEARREGGEQFGDERLKQIVLDAHCAGRLAGEALHTAVVDFATAGGIGDDATFIGARLGRDVPVGGPT